MEMKKSTGTDAITERESRLGLDLSQMRPRGFLEKMHQSERVLIDKVSSGAGWVYNEGCLVCESANRTVEWSAYGIDLFCCAECEHRYFEKMPADLSEVYEGDEYLENSKDSYLTNVDYRLARFAAERIALINDAYPFNKKQRLLDVGCGTGWFLSAAKSAGYDCSGYEFSSSLAGYTSSSVGCEVFDGEISSINKQFDVITLFDVIEHVPRPLLTFKELRQLLAPEGIILVYTPNFKSVALSRQKGESNLVMPTRHLSYFCHASVERLCKLSGMELMWYETAGIDIGDIYAWLNSLGEEEDLRAWQRLSDVMQPALDASGVGNHLRFIARATG